MEYHDEGRCQHNRIYKRRAFREFILPLWDNYIAQCLDCYSCNIYGKSLNVLIFERFTWIVCFVGDIESHPYSNWTTSIFCRQFSCYDYAVFCDCYLFHREADCGLPRCLLDTTHTAHETCLTITQPLNKVGQYIY